MKVLIALLIATFLLSSCNQNNDKKSNTITNEYPQNIKILLQQIKQKPDSVGLRLLLINAFDSINNYHDAIMQMDTLIIKDSLNYGLWYRKAKLEEGNKDTTSAIECYYKAINVYPSPDALLSVANLLAEKRNAKALNFCKQVEDMRMGREYDAHTNFIKGIFNARIGNKVLAEQYFNECIKNDYTYMVAYLEKGFIYYDAQKFNDALKIFAQAAEINNLYADAYYWQAKCYEALNDKSNAVLNYKNAVALDKSLKEAQQAIERLQH